MGTRSLTHVKGGNISFYRQMDGYPEGHGKELAEFLKGFTIVNGYGQVTDKMANGMDCLALQIVAHFKEGIGGFYAIKHNSKGHGEEYTYTVYLKDGAWAPKLKVVEIGGGDEPDEVLFDGTPDEYLEWLKTKEDC